MHVVLMVCGDIALVDSFRRVINIDGYRFHAAQSGREAMAMARECGVDVALIDLALTEVSAFDVLRELRSIEAAPACVILTGSATTQALVEGMRLGACDCVQTPAAEETILAAIGRAVSSRRPKTGAAPNSIDTEPHALRRWAQRVVLFIDSPRDAATLRDFGRVVGVSAGGFRNWCRTAGLSSRRSVAFARALRAIHRQQKDRSLRPENLLSIVDLRTVAKFLLASGGTTTQLPTDVDAFLERQQFIPNQAAIHEIRRALRGWESARNPGAPPKLFRRSADWATLSRGARSVETTDV
jgi:ActR/RegA family two-component response regulator